MKHQVGIRWQSGFAFLLLGVTAACGSGGSDGSNTGTGATAGSAGMGAEPGGTAGAGGSAGASAACNTLVQLGDAVDEIRVASDPPVLQGGALTNGTFVLREVRVYTGTGGPTGPTGKTVRDTLRFSNASPNAATAEELYQETGSAERRFAGAATTTGTSLTVQATCPGGVWTGPYEATADTFMAGFPGDGSLGVWVRVQP
jgi:hypothetical protein